MARTERCAPYNPLCAPQVLGVFGGALDTGAVGGALSGVPHLSMGIRESLQKTGKAPLGQLGCKQTPHSQGKGVRSDTRWGGEGGGVVGRRRDHFRVAETAVKGAASLDVGGLALHKLRL